MKTLSLPRLAPLLLCTLALDPGTCRAQLHRAWVKTYSGNPAALNQTVTATLAPDGDLLVAGSSANSNGDLDYLVIKYAPNGDERWRLRHDRGANDQLRAMAVDANGNIVLTGTSGSVCFDKTRNFLWDADYPGRSLAIYSNFVFITGFSEVDFSLTKFDLQGGTNVWTRTYDGLAKGPEFSSVVAVDESGNSTISGYEAIDCSGPGFGCQRRLTTLRYSPSGAQLWRNRFDDGIGYGGNVRAIKILGQNVYVTGNDPYADTFLTKKYDSSGVIVWSYSAYYDPDGQFYGEVHSMVVNAIGEVYLTGQKAINDQGDWNWRTLKINNNGGRQWLIDYHGDKSGLNQGSAIAVDPLGDCYVTGSSPNQATANDLATIMYDSNGHQLWADRYDGVAHRDDFGTAVIVDKVGIVYVTGYSTTPEGGSEFVTIKYSPDAKIQQKPGGAMNIQFLTNPNTAYILQGTTNFFDWTNLLTNTADANGFVQFDDTQAPSIPFRVYRGKAPQ